MFKKLPALLILATSTSRLLVHALPTYSDKTIIWYPCGDSTTIPYSCGNLTVPLDYTDHSSAKTLSLSLVKVNATKQPSQGSILFNPGGPGEIGTSFVAATADVFLAVTGGNYDLIGFDTRGTGTTLPFSCYASDDERVIFVLKGPLTTNASATSLGESWAVGQSLAQNCYDNARDVGELNWDRGTVLGETVAAMFPERMDKIVLDGVLNPTQYYEGRDIQELAASEATFAGFFA
ncbi:uncharacterized protein LY89DRAFT_736537 [Mollisia scopiformis]|uniref:AB hydrolase-1 domain-containing protein n=1 Tax=Mollisia scopiformis TaxID=149040 RepID=A0A194X2U3_MOLSC|nr:uncharacterized protein LY89DRAFT_736537 [Mollisia scopiformis]KUJ14505.1 hypothetical protein LY89DRAFT_736537 [Mollisia scopiformis]